MKQLAFIHQSLRLLRRELRHGLRGFGVFLSCLFLGVFAIAAIGNFSQAARSGLLRDAAALLGGDLEIRQRHYPASDEQIEYLRSAATISTTREMRAMATAEQSDKRGLIELKAVDTLYPLYGQFVLKSEDSLQQVLTGSEGSVVVEEEFLRRFATSVGETIRIGDREFRIAAVIHSEPDRAVRAFNLGPRVMLSQQSLDQTGLVQPGSLMTFRYRLRFAEQEQADSFKQQLQERFPDAGWRVRNWRQAAPRVRYVLDRMETNLTLLGLCSLLVGGLGVSGAVRGYLNGKRNDIATMKCLGASKRLIFTTYLLQIMLLGLCGSLVGLICGAALPFLLIKVFGAALPLPLNPGFFPSVWIISSLFGLLIALLFSLYELGKACEITPATLFRGYSSSAGRGPSGRVWLLLILSAVALTALALLNSADRYLALWFMLGAGGAMLVFRLLTWGLLKLAERLPRLPHATMRLALTNMQSPGAPAGAMIFSLGLGLTALVMIVQVQGRLNSMVTETLPQDAPAYFFFDIQKDQLPQIQQIVAEDPHVGRFSYSPTLRGRITQIAGVAAEQAQIDPDVRWAVRGDRFLSYAAEQPDNAKLTAGQWWPRDYQGKPLVSLTSDLAKGFGLEVGDSISFNIIGRAITAEVANVREVDWTTLELNFAIIFAPGTLEGAPHSSIAAVHLPPEHQERFYKKVTDSFANVSALSVGEILANVSRTLSRVGLAFKGMAAIALLTGFLVLIGTVSADQHRRLRDAVIYQVCGASRLKILAVFGYEFFFIGLATAVMSLFVGSLAAYALLSGPLDTTWEFSPVLMMMTLTAGILLTMVLGLLGTWKTLGHKPARYLRRD